ncbi:MAG TPA: SDR family oxidoreductase [Streptosporangiaceae bacterium]|jgi:uncharacterized protein YbjT (DUF2867 family)
MTSLILVTGGTGTLGRQVAARLRAADGKVRVLSRRSHPPADGVEFVAGDLLTGEGAGSAVDGAGVIVHCASSNKGDADATRNLVRAAASLPEAPHVVYISIVGSELVSFGYTREKLEAERLVSGSGLPWTTLRATQFYDLIFKGARALARLPVVPVPAGFVIQPVDSGEVAARLAELALGQPAGRVPDMGGPEVTSFAGLLRSYLRASHRRRPVVPVWMPGIRAVRAGALLVPPEEAAKPGYVAGQRTWEEFLAGKVRQPAHGR